MNDIKDIGEFDKDLFIHKLNSYLSSIYGYLQMLDKKTENQEDIKKLVEKAENECKKLIEFIEKQK